MNLTGESEILSGIRSICIDPFTENCKGQHGAIPQKVPTTAMHHHAIHFSQSKFLSSPSMQKTIL